MQEKVRPTVHEAVRAFLIVCGDCPDIDGQLGRFIAKLQSDRQWTTNEVYDVYRLITDQLSLPSSP